MLNISVLVPQERISCAINLPVPLSEVMEEDRSYDWFGRLRLRIMRDDVLEADIQTSDPDILEPLLQEVQAGLLYAALSGMRLRPGPADTALPGLARFARRVDLTDPSGRVAILALWAPGVELRTAVRTAEAGRYTHLILLRGTSRLRPRLSVLVPGRDAERTLAELTHLAGLRVRPPTLEVEPEPVEETVSAPPTRARKRRRPHPSPVTDVALPLLEEGAPDTGWAAPYLAVLTRGLVFTPPLEELERIAVRLRNTISEETSPDLIRGRILRALIQGWRIGSDPERLRTERLRYPPNRLHDLFRDRARAMETVSRGYRDTDPLLLMTRVSVFQAWAFGAAPARRGMPLPDRRFREERSTRCRSLPEAAIRALAELPGVTEPDALAPLIKDGLISEGPDHILSEAGQRILEELTAPVGDDLPSLLDLVGPTPEALRALELTDRPRRGRPSKRDQDPQSGMERLLGAADDLVRLIPETGSDPLPDPLTDLLIRAWRLGKDRKRPPQPGVRVKAGGEVGPYLTEQARVISEATLAARTGPDPELARTLVRGAIVEAWRLGSGPKPLRAPSPRYREECSAPLRPLPPSARQALMALHQEEDVSPARGDLNALMREGFLLSLESGLLTAAGTAAALAEIAHRSEARPGVLGIIGTRVPIRSNPDAVRIPRRHRTILDRLAEAATTPKTRGRPPRSDPFRGHALRALTAAYWLPRPAPDPDRTRRAPTRVSKELDRVARALADLTLKDRTERGLIVARGPLREACTLAYQMGATQEGD